ncbi:hypothetical protein QCA50_016982 [Cerrena zonata]|uniref:Uncharacterized protein n=1 Tax=Cerrena zonata TaxID=2478898 RepID=A0AAW0FGX5_9APHY
MHLVPTTDDVLESSVVTAHLQSKTLALSTCSADVEKSIFEIERVTRRNPKRGPINDQKTNKNVQDISALLNGDANKTVDRKLGSTNCGREEKDLQLGSQGKSRRHIENGKRMG